MPRVEFIFDGDRQNASACTVCKRTCHIACLFNWEEKAYCIFCYKKGPVKNEDTSIMFDEIFQKHKKARRGEATPVRQDMHEFIDNYLQTSNFEMNCKQFSEWRVKSKPSGKSSNNRESNLSRKKLVDNNEERKKGWKEHARYELMKRSYETAIKLAKEDWLLANDGIVTGLRYNGGNQHFVAKVVYDEDGVEKEEKIIVADDWIIDTYGSHVLAKLMDRERNDDFVNYP